MKALQPPDFGFNFDTWTIARFQDELEKLEDSNTLNVPFPPHAKRGGLQAAVEKHYALERERLGKAPKDYLSLGYNFTWKTYTCAQMKQILSHHDIPYPSAVKKDDLMTIFHDNIELLRELNGYTQDLPPRPAPKSKTTRTSAAKAADPAVSTHTPPRIGMRGGATRSAPAVVDMPSPPATPPRYTTRSCSRTVASAPSHTRRPRAPDSEVDVQILVEDVKNNSAVAVQLIAMGRVDEALGYLEESVKACRDVVRGGNRASCVDAGE